MAKKEGKAKSRRRRSLFLIDGHRNNFRAIPGQILVKEIVALRRLQRRNSVEFRDIREMDLSGLHFPEASVVGSQGLVTLRNELSRNTLFSHSQVPLRLPS